MQPVTQAGDQGATAAVDQRLILVVDCAPEWRRALAQALTGEYSLREAADGEQAWDLIRSDERIEVVITALDMPHLDGYGLIRRMRNSVIARIHHLPVIVVTAAEDATAHEAAFQCGANDFITHTSDRVELLARLRAQCKLAQTVRQLEESQRELRAQANTDTLTGLANRRFFSQIAHKQISHSRRNQESLAVLMMDIDHFKSINDTYGHPAGDHVLCELARMLAENLRAEDVIARVGGEEFAVCCPSTNRLEAIVLAEHLRQATESLEIYFESNRIPVTLSIGIAVLPQDGDILSDLMGKADDRLYTAKQGGRNRFCATDSAAAERVGERRGQEMVCPRLDEALVMVTHGNLHRLMPHLHTLLNDLLPLLELANREAGGKIDLDQLRSEIDRLQR